MACEDFPCCGHEYGCCPSFDEAGNQLDMVCTCGARLPVDNRYSICDSCMDADNDDYGYQDEEDYDYEDNMSDVEADADTLRSAGWGTDEDYGYFGGGEDW